MQGRLLLGLFLLLLFSRRSLMWLYIHCKLRIGIVLAIFCCVVLLVIVTVIVVFCSSFYFAKIDRVCNDSQKNNKTNK